MTTLASVRSGLTWEEFLALPDLPDYRHAELIDGNVVVNPPSRLHQQIVGRLASAIDAWARAQPGARRGDAGPPGAGRRRPRVPARRRVVPADRCAPPGQPPAFSGRPALAVEVLSPTTRAIDAVRKRTDYARANGDELWLVDPDGPATLILRRPSGAPADAEFALVGELDAGGTLASPLLPGLTVPLAELLAR